MEIILSGPALIGCALQRRLRSRGRGTQKHASALLCDCTHVRRKRSVCWQGASRGLPDQRVGPG